MTKTEATELFGGTQSALAAALGVSRSAISQWPEQLSRMQADRVLGAAARLGRLPKPKPDKVA
jgi:UTP--glucose-1-phosphate uridylyltransferase